MKVFSYTLLVLFLLVACQKTKSEAPHAPAADSTEVVVDSPQQDSIPEPPKAADGLFDDFIYSFMRSPRFQLSRTDFPLPHSIDGTNHLIERSAWKHDRLYSLQETYTVIFDNAKQIKAEKDTSIHHVIVEWVNLDRKRVKQYLFNKVQGQWRLTGLESHGLKHNVNSDFYSFYDQFSKSTSFQLKHIANPFSFKTYDSDNFQAIEGVLDVAQWPDYRPDLPKGTITNVNYGQNYGNARRRILMVCSPSGGMGSSLTFVRSGKTWMLERLEN